ASSAPLSAAPAARIPSGAAPTTAPQLGMIGGRTTPRMSPAAMASPSPWQMARNTEREATWSQVEDPWPERALPLRASASATLSAMSESGRQPDRAAGRQGAPRRRRPHSTSRDLERYADLFAKRTQVMRSSAMRDLMAI